MSELRVQLATSRHAAAQGGFFLAKLLDLLCGDSPELLLVASQSY